VARGCLQVSEWGSHRLVAVGHTNDGAQGNYDALLWCPVVVVKLWEREGVDKGLCPLFVIHKVAPLSYLVQMCSRASLCRNAVPSLSSFPVPSPCCQSGHPPCHALLLLVYAAPYVANSFFGCHPCQCITTPITVQLCYSM